MAGLSKAGRWCDTLASSMVHLPSFSLCNNSSVFSHAQRNSSWIVVTASPLGLSHAASRHGTRCAKFNERHCIQPRGVFAPFRCKAVVSTRGSIFIQSRASGVYNICCRFVDSGCRRSLVHCLIARNAAACRYARMPNYSMYAYFSLQSFVVLVVNNLSARNRSWQARPATTLCFGCCWPLWSRARRPCASGVCSEDRETLLVQCARLLRQRQQSLARMRAIA
eukprot:6180708-Pleurochrysis_carterae.AAC.3